MNFAVPLYSPPVEKRWPMSSFCALIYITLTKKTAFICENSLWKKNIIDIIQNVVYHWNVKSIKYRSRFVTCNNAPAKHQSWVTSSRMTFDTICKVHYTFCCNNSQVSIHVLMWIRLFFWPDTHCVFKREQCWCTFAEIYTDSR